jgi:hypothetical protein
VSPLGFEFGQARFDRVLPQVDDFYCRTVSSQAFHNGQSNPGSAARYNSDLSSEIDKCWFHLLLDSRLLTVDGLLIQHNQFTIPLKHGRT